jgi:hypothetical protein
MKLNLVPARTGVLWVREGLKTFRRQPIAFIALFFSLMTVVSTVAQLPLVGVALALMLLPAMTLGLMAAAAQAAQLAPGQPAARPIFLAALQALRASARPMTVLGMIYAALFLAVMAISALADGGQFTRGYLLGGELTPEIAQSAEFQIALWIAMILYLPLSLAFWHAPALAHWHRVPPVKSLFFSFVACIRNFGALAVYALIWAGLSLGVGVVLSLLASLAGLGIGIGASVMGGAMVFSGVLLVMAAMFFTSTWFTFRDSFENNET